MKHIFSIIMLVLYAISAFSQTTQRNTGKLTMDRMGPAKANSEPIVTTANQPRPAVQMDRFKPVPVPANAVITNTPRKTVSTNDRMKPAKKR